MEFRMIRGDCPDGRTCPAVRVTDRGTLLVTGTRITDPAALAALRAGPDEAVVEVPQTLIPEAAAEPGRWAFVRSTGRGTLLITGTRITDPALLAALPAGPDEAVVETADALIPEAAAHAG